MRTGVLADSNNSFFQPMDHVSHERHLGVAHIAKHTRTTRKRKQGYRSTTRPRAPYMAHYELAQLMNPENPRGSLEAFSTHMEASQRPNPPASFKMLVENFKRDNPSYVSRHRDKMLLDETAYFLQKTGLNPDSYFHHPQLHPDLPAYRPPPSSPPGANSWLGEGALDVHPLPLRRR